MMDVPLPEVPARLKELALYLDRLGVKIDVDVVIIGDGSYLGVNTYVVYRFTMIRRTRIFGFTWKRRIKLFEVHESRVGELDELDGFVRRAKVA